jgi:regulator of sigma E protease
MSVLIFVVGILLFIGLVIVHELGHFVTARRNGVDAEEFGIFFPPRIYSRKMKSGWIFSVNALPLGGFVKLKGEHDTDTGKGSYGAASTWVKTKIMAAGVVMNLIVALVLLTILSLVGMPKLVDNQFTVHGNTKVIRHATTSVLVDGVVSGSPATRAGLKSNDEITRMGPKNQMQATPTVASLQTATKKYAGQAVVIDYTRNNHAQSGVTTLNSVAVATASAKTAHPKGYLGVSLEDSSTGVTLERSTWAAPIVAIGTAGQFTALTFEGLGHALAGVGGIIAGTTTDNSTARHNGQTKASSQVGGPIAIYYVLKDGSSLGWDFMLFIIAIISLTLAIMNILPIPALDGGRLWLTLISRGLKRPISKEREELINGIGFALLLALIGLISYVDINRFR